MHIELICSILGSAAIMIWRLAVFASEQKRHREMLDELQKQQDRMRARHHDKIAPTIQGLVFKVEEIEDRLGHRGGPYRASPDLPSWDDLDDSRVTEDAKKEPTK